MTPAWTVLHMLPGHSSVAAFYGVIHGSDMLDMKIHILRAPTDLESRGNNLVRDFVDSQGKTMCIVQVV